MFFPLLCKALCVYWKISLFTRCHVRLCQTYQMFLIQYVGKPNHTVSYHSVLLSVSAPSLQKSMSTYVSDCYDSIAVFLCIHIILRFRAITAKRNIPALDKSVSHYWSELLEQPEEVLQFSVLWISFGAFKGLETHPAAVIYIFGQN